MAAKQQEVLPESIEVWLRPLMDFFSHYHQHEVVGMEHIPKRRAALLVFNHSLATYDAFLLGYQIYLQRGRLIKGLGDNLIFKLPYLSTFANHIGIKPAAHEHGEALIAAKKLVGVAPGGMREALRPSHQAYQILWQKRKGFIRLALKTRTPIILAACPAADAIYKVYESPLTKLGYKLFKVPIPVARGIGPTALPKPIKLTHYISEPIMPPKLNPEKFEAQVERLHKKVCLKMSEMMGRDHYAES